MPETHTEIHTGKNRNRTVMIDGPAVLCLFLSSEHLPEDVSCALDTLFVGVSIQPKGSTLICVTQLFGGGGNIRAVCYSHAGEAVTQFVGAVHGSIRKALKVAVGCL